jgi:hypothetical protein
LIYQVPIQAGDQLRVPVITHLNTQENKQLKSSTDNPQKKRTEHLLGTYRKALGLDIICIPSSKNGLFRAILTIITAPSK